MLPICAVPFFLRPVIHDLCFFSQSEDAAPLLSQDQDKRDSIKRDASHEMVMFKHTTKFALVFVPAILTFVSLGGTAALVAVLLVRENSISISID
jgi:hypothetical protein